MITENNKWKRPLTPEHTKTHPMGSSTKDRTTPLARTVTTETVVHVLAMSYIGNTFPASWVHGGESPANTQATRPGPAI